MSDECKARITPKCGIELMDMGRGSNPCDICKYRNIPTCQCVIVSGLCDDAYNPDTGECPGCKWTPLDTAKADTGKPRLALVPPGIIEAVGIIRTYGTAKYGDPDNWRRVEPWRYKDALMRHLVAWLRDDQAVDAESGYPHLWHMACNLAFLIEMEKSNPKNNPEG